MTVPDLAPGHVLGGKYAIQSLLARSAAASTYRALVNGNQEVVVKVLDAALAFRQDTQNEILRVGASISALSPSHVIQPLEHGKDPGTGALFIVAPFCPALNLARFVERPLPPEDVMSFLRSLGHVLDEAHKAGVVHLALKPTNVFVTPGPTMSVVVGDFGANAIRTHLPDDARQLDAAWLAPEQMGGDGFSAPTADVFAAGLLAFFALTGRRFWRSCAGATSDLAAWRVEVTQTPMTASQRAAELGVMLPPIFDAALSQALGLPQHRQRTVGELAQAFSAAWNVTGRGTGTLVMSTSPLPFAPGGTGGGGAVPEAPAAAALAPLAPSAPLEAPPPNAPPAPAAAGEPAPNFATDPPAVAGAPAAAAPGVGNSVVPQPPKGGGSKTWLFVVVGVILIGGIVGTVLALRARQAGAAYAAAASASAQMAAASASAQAAAASASAQAAAASASAEAATALGTAGAPAASAAPAAPAGSVAAADSAAPAASAAPADSAGAAPAVPGTAAPEPPAPDSAQLTIVCDPTCDSLTLDQQPAAGGAGPSPVAAGAHTIVASRAHCVDQTKTVTAKAGDKLTVTFKLVKADAPAVAAAPATTTAQGTAPTAKKPCGKFLKRCTD